MPQWCMGTHSCSYKYSYIFVGERAARVVVVTRPRYGARTDDYAPPPLARARQCRCCTRVSRTAE